MSLVDEVKALDNLPEKGRLNALALIVEELAREIASLREDLENCDGCKEDSV